MLILLEDADIGLLYKELLDRHFHNLYIYKQKRDLLVLYLKNLGVKYIEIQ
tara:strand:+ start:34 stop:186 length:153 start_codon:yes stop_codon:yes gene_type:complete